MLNESSLPCLCVFDSWHTFRHMYLLEHIGFALWATCRVNLGIGNHVCLQISVLRNTPRYAVSKDQGISKIVFCISARSSESAICQQPIT